MLRPTRYESTVSTSRNDGGCAAWDRAAMVRDGNFCDTTGTGVLATLSTQNFDWNDARLQQGACCIRHRLRRQFAVDQHHRTMRRFLAAFDQRPRAGAKGPRLLRGAVQSNDVEPGVQQAAPRLFRRRQE